MLAELAFYAAYVRGRCMKTETRVKADGTFTLDTTIRGEAATRWVARPPGQEDPVGGTG